tara:strand:- start:2761 stop:3432 length:672 start_codon:yes stop_codon:yes gene_type:complete
VPWWSHLDPTPRDGVKSALVGEGSPFNPESFLLLSKAGGVHVPMGIDLPIFCGISLEAKLKVSNLSSSVRFRYSALVFITMLKEFLQWFEGEYDNWNQASSHPTSFAHIILKHEKVSNNTFHVTQRYSHEEKPYRDKIIQVCKHRDIIVIENDQCNLLFEKKNGVYRGGTVPGCIFKETLLVSRVELGPSHYVVIDAGLDPVTKEQKWGSENGPFVFDKKINN